MRHALAATMSAPLHSLPAVQRWVRDDRWEGKSLTTVQPLSGTAYTVWPVMWGERWQRAGLPPHAGGT